MWSFRTYDTLNEDCEKTVYRKNMKKMSFDSSSRALQTLWTSCIPKVSLFGRNRENKILTSFFDMKKWLWEKFYICLFGSFHRVLQYRVIKKIWIFRIFSVDSLLNENELINPQFFCAYLVEKSIAHILNDLDFPYWPYLTSYRCLKSEKCKKRVIRKIKIWPHFLTWKNGCRKNFIYAFLVPLIEYYKIGS
jgi:hypothetical protein